MVFDKTGTLTQDGMTLHGIMSAATSLDHVRQTKELEGEQSLFLENLVCCHSLKKAGNELVGDIMDVVIFNSTGWDFIDGGSDGARTTMKSASGRDIKVVHLFHFDSISKRMGVISKENSEYRFHLKGAPEVISSLCDPRTIPERLDAILNEYAQKGLRVLACATGPVPDSALQGSFLDLKRESLEASLTFLGIVILENKLKPETKAALDTLLEAEIKVVMATGDASLTGLAVGRECGIVPLQDEIFIGDLATGGVMWQRHVFIGEETERGRADIVTVGKVKSLELSENILQTEMDRMGSISADTNILYQLRQSNYSVVLTGRAFEELVNRGKSGSKTDEILLRACLDKCRVYARMSPEQKTLLVEQLKTTKVLVGMCGDGANDCGALKAADVGVSLSDAEASIAAPFTSKIQNISSVIDVLQEGRCALATSFMSFKFMALYSIIQFSSVCTLYWWGASLGDFEFLYADLFMVLPLTVLMSYTGSYPKLAKKTPGNTLINVPILTSVIGSGILCFSSQIMAWGYTSRQSWFTTVDINDSESNGGLVSSENSAIYLMSNFNYVTIVLLFNIGRPFRKEPYSNLPFTVWYLFLVFLALYQLLAPPTWMRSFFGLVDFDRDFKGKMLGLVVAYVAAASIYEKGVLYVVDKVYWAVKRRNAKRRVFADVSEEMLISFNSTII